MIEYIVKYMIKYIMQLYIYICIQTHIQATRWLLIKVVQQVGFLRVDYYSELPRHSGASNSFVFRFSISIKKGFGSNQQPGPKLSTNVYTY